jgi:hypothetical protein
MACFLPCVLIPAGTCTAAGSLLLKYNSDDPLLFSYNATFRETITSITRIGTTLAVRMTIADAEDDTVLLPIFKLVPRTSLRS